MKGLSETTRTINTMLNVRELQKTGMVLQKQMMQMGIVTEMVEEVMEDGMMDSEEEDEEVDDIIN